MAIRLVAKSDNAHGYSPRFRLITQKQFGGLNAIATLHTSTRFRILTPQFRAIILGILTVNSSALGLGTPPALLALNERQNRVFSHSNLARDSRVQGYMCKTLAGPTLLPTLLLYPLQHRDSNLGLSRTRPPPPPARTPLIGKTTVARCVIFNIYIQNMYMQLRTRLRANPGTQGDVAARGWGG